MFLQCCSACRLTDELIQLYALECFLDRLARSEFSADFVLKGGVLLAALNARRPTRDIDFAVQATDNDTDTVLRLVQPIAAIPLGDGIEFYTGAAAESIRSPAVDEVASHLRSSRHQCSAMYIQKRQHWRNPR